MILSREPLLDVIPIHRREADGAIITQFDMGACESTGLLKMDFLGLRNLSVLDDALLNIKENQGVDGKKAPNTSLGGFSFRHQPPLRALGFYACQELLIVEG